MRGGVHKQICAKTVNLKVAVPTLLLLNFKRDFIDIVNTNLLFKVNFKVFSTGGVPVLYRFMSTGRHTATCNVVGVANIFTKTTIARILKG